MVSIICPIYNEERFIESCLQSILEQDLPSTKWELMLIDGESTDNTRSIVQRYCVKYPNIQLVNNPQHTAPCALNIGIRAAKGDFICRIDAHSAFQKDYISTLLRYMEELSDAANVGGVCQTLPANDSLKAQAIAIACSHPFGVGNSTFRTAVVNRPTETDTVPFGFWKKSLFDEIGLFDEELTRNQDDEFNARTIQHGGHIYLVPGIRTTYYARDTFSKTWQMFYQYGLYKPLVNKKIKHPATIRQFVPLFFVLGLIIGLPLACLSKVFCGIYLGCIALYSIATCTVGILRRNLYMPFAFACLHIGYGLGYLIGICKILFRSHFNVYINR